MAASQLDRIVKGAPPPDVSADQVASAARKASTSSSVTAPQPLAQDPVSHLPSSPPQIYLNLLILESSLRAQYLCLRARLRLHILLFGALAAWTLTFAYLLFLRPREDGKGTGGSVYWVVDTGEKMGFVGAAVTWGLVWGTGLWNRGIRWPRKWVGITNRGLRGFNLKVVVIKGSVWTEFRNYISLLGTSAYRSSARGMRYEYLPRDIERSLGEKDKNIRSEDGRKQAWVEEDIAPGGDTIKLLLLPKPFSPDFREEWDTYRTTYWDKENERRAILRKWVKAKDREMAKREGGWLWWTGWRGWSRFLGQRPPGPDPKLKVTRDRPVMQHVKRDKKIGIDGGSRTSSRSSTPTPDPDGTHRKSLADSKRRDSSLKRPLIARKKPSSSSMAPTRASQRITPDSRASTPDTVSTVSAPAPDPPMTRSVTKQASGLQTSNEADANIKKEGPSDTEVVIKKEEDE